ncbi:Uncharacterised protein [Achromobacter ruhlandii]|nr:Uncharacterised protein [Achromobacter ruhlandii]CUJ83861.1 Uncharacterised protein [Achromobacter ruhlandii]
MLGLAERGHGDAMALDLLEQGRIFRRDALARDHDLLLAGVQRGLAHDVAVLLRPRIPHLAVDHEDQRIGHVVPQRQVLLADGVELGAGVDRQRVLLAVDRAAGQRRLGVGPAHLGRVGAQRGERVDVQRRADHAQLHALHVLGPLDLALGVAELAVAVLAPGQRHHAGLLDQLEHLLAHVALHQRVDGGVVRHQEGQREQIQLLDLRRPVDGRADGHVDHALADGGEFAGLVALHQRGAGVDLDVDAALRALAHQVGPDLGALAPRESGADDDGELVFGLVVLRLRGGGQANHGGGAQGGADQLAEIHVASPLFAGLSVVVMNACRTSRSGSLNNPACAAATAPAAGTPAPPPAPGTSRPAATPPSARSIPSARARCGTTPSG